MIKKQHRLKEREVKKVLAKSKPFFSYGVVLNINNNKKSFNRFAIIIGSKSVTTNITRNYFRRFFYDLISRSGFLFETNSNSKNFDYVFILKKQTKLDKNYKHTILLFEKDLNFLLKKSKIQTKIK